MSLFPLSLNLPDLLRAQLSAAQEAGHYATEEELVADAVRTFLAARPDVRIASACRLYELGVVSLIKAAELAEVDAVSLKRLLHERGITRAAPESWTETEAMAHAALSAYGCACDDSIGGLPRTRRYGFAQSPPVPGLDQG